MKLYHFPVSPNSRRVLATACHLGIDLELQTLDLARGEHIKPGFVKLNPNHKVPTLVDDDFVLWESGAIMLYLVGQKPGNSLYASDGKGQADINRWLFWNTAHWNTTCGIYIYEHLVKKFLAIGAADTAELKKANELFHRYAAVLEAHLQGRDWLVGEAVTLADFAVGSTLDLAEKANYPLNDYSEVKRWYGNIEKLEAWKKSAPENFM